jgi:hypothetical protein
VIGPYNFKYEHLQAHSGSEAANILG